MQHADPHSISPPKPQPKRTSLSISAWSRQPDAVLNQSFVSGSAGVTPGTAHWKSSRASEWQTLHRYSPLLGESFVDPAKVRGTCYRAANWIEVDRLLADRMGEVNPDEQAAAIDSKSLRGSWDQDLDEDGKQRDEPPQQHPGAVGIGSGVVVGQTGYSGKKGDAEAAALRRLVAELNLRQGTVVVADAVHTRRKTAELLEGLGLHYVFTAKRNQPKIHALLAAEHVWGAPQHVRTDCGHGRVEIRSICVTEEIGRDVPKPWTDSPGVRPAAEVRRAVEYNKTGNKRDPETARLITNLPPGQATPENLLEINRGYWGAAENKVHHVRDVALREDASRCRKGSFPRVLASFANLALSILRMRKATTIAQCMGNLHQKSSKAVKILHDGRQMGALATA